MDFLIAVINAYLFTGLVISTIMYLIIPKKRKIPIVFVIFLYLLVSTCWLPWLIEYHNKKGK